MVVGYNVFITQIFWSTRCRRMQEVAGDGLIEEAAVGSALRPYLEEIISMSNLALACATECRDLLEPGRLSDALADCVTQGVMAPFSPCVRGTPKHALCVERRRR